MLPWWLEDNLLRVDSLLPPCESSGSNLGLRSSDLRPTIFSLSHLNDTPIYFFKFCFVYLERSINEVFGISQQGYVSPEDVPNDLRRITRGLQLFELKSRAKPFSFLLLKKAKHEVMFTVSLSKYKYSKGLHLVLCLIIFGHVKRTRNILCRFLSLRDNIDMPGHFLHVLDFKGIHLP